MTEKEGEVVVDDKEAERLCNWLCSYIGLKAETDDSKRSIRNILKDETILATIISKACPHSGPSGSTPTSSMGDDGAFSDDGMKVAAKDAEDTTSQVLDDYFATLQKLGMKKESLFLPSDLQDSAENNPESRKRLLNHVAALKKLPSVRRAISMPAAGLHVSVANPSVDESFTDEEKDILLWARNELLPMGRVLPVQNKEETIDALKDGQPLIMLAELLTGVSGGHYYQRVAADSERAHNISQFLVILAKKEMKLPEGVDADKLADGDLKALTSCLRLLRENFDLDYIFTQKLIMEAKKEAGESKPGPVVVTVSPKIPSPIQAVEKDQSPEKELSKFEEEEKKFMKSLRRLSLPYRVVVPVDPVQEQKHEERKQWYIQKHQRKSLVLPQEAGRKSPEKPLDLLDTGADASVVHHPLTRHMSQIEGRDGEQLASSPEARLEFSPSVGALRRSPVSEPTLTPPALMTSPSSLFSPTLKPALPRPLPGSFRDERPPPVKVDEDVDILLVQDQKKVPQASKVEAEDEGQVSSPSESDPSAPESPVDKDKGDKEKVKEGKSKSRRKKTKKTKKEKKEGDDANQEPSKPHRHRHRDKDRAARDDAGSKKNNMTLIVVSPRAPEPMRGPLSPTALDLTALTQSGERQHRPTSSTSKKPKKHRDQSPVDPPSPSEFSGSQLADDTMYSDSRNSDQSLGSNGSAAYNRPPPHHIPKPSNTITIEEAILAASGGREIESSANALVPLNGRRFESWPSLDMVLGDPILKASFFQFMQDEYALENILFYEDVLHYRALYAANPNSRAVQKEAHRIYREYFTETSENEINVSWETKTAIKNLFEPASGHPPDSVHASVWDPAFKEMMGLLHTDLFVRWYNGMQPPNASTFEEQLKEKKRAKLVKQIGFSQAALSFFGVKETVRVKAVERLRDSEKAYVKALSTCVDEVMRPLIDQQLLTEEEMWNVFGPLKVLHIYHSNLLSRLQDTLAAWHDHISTIGDVFLDNAAFLPLYSCYIRNYARSILFYRQICITKPVFTKYAEAYDKKHFGDYSLQDVLALPCDRLDQYIALLESIQKYTPKSHVDAALLAKCYEHVYHLSSRISFLPDAHSIVENRRLIAVCDNIHGIEGQCLIVPGRRLMREGVVSIKREEQLEQSSDDAESIEDSPMDSVLILFSDLIVCCNVISSAIGKWATAQPVSLESPSVQVSPGGTTRQRRSHSVVRSGENSPAREVSPALPSPGPVPVPKSLSVASSIPLSNIDDVSTDTDDVGRKRIHIHSTTGDHWAFFDPVSDKETEEWLEVLTHTRREASS